MFLGRKRWKADSGPGPLVSSLNGNLTTQLKRKILQLTAIAPENRGPREKEIPIGNPTIFRGELLVLGSVIREKKNDWLGYIRDEILPSYIGIIMSLYKDPYQPASIMECQHPIEKENHTVDGSEIRRAPVDMVFYPIISGVLAPSQAVQGFFHQQYEPKHHFQVPAVNPRGWGV